MDVDYRCRVSTSNDMTNKMATVHDMAMALELNLIMLKQVPEMSVDIRGSCLMMLQE